MTPALTTNSPIPLYKQAADHLKDSISKGRLLPGDQIPSETQLMKEFNVSRITIRAAISELVEEGILTRSQGKGTFVSHYKTLYPAYDKAGFHNSCKLAGVVPYTRFLNIEWVYPSNKYIKLWNIGPQDKIIRLQRLRSVDGIPIMLETNHFPESFSYLFDENLNNSLFAVLQKHDFEFTVRSRTLEICFPSLEEATLLDISTSVPLLLFQDVHNDRNGHATFTSKELYNSNRTKFHF